MMQFNIKVRRMDFEYVKQRFNALEEKLQGLVELNNRLVLENIKLNQRFNNAQGVEAAKPLRSTGVEVAPPSVPRTAPEPPKPKVLEILQNDGVGSIKVIGNTYLHRSLLKENGGSWDKNISGWVFSDTCLDQLVNALTEREVEFINHVARSTGVEEALPLRSTGVEAVLEFMED
jgi:hypothetical protein